MAAVRTILIADLVMSLDNVIGVAAAAKGNLLLLTIGLGLSIPLVVFGSSLMIGLMTRFPVIIRLGAALIGWVAGETLISDVMVAHLISHLTWLHWLVQVSVPYWFCSPGDCWQCLRRVRKMKKRRLKRLLKI
jgi:predicted tellurium resistance membrane protein TerC